MDKKKRTIKRKVQIVFYLVSQNPLRERLKICLKLPVVWQEFEDIISANSQWLILKKIRLEMILTRKL